MSKNEDENNYTNISLKFIDLLNLKKTNEKVKLRSFLKSFLKYTYNKYDKFMVLFESMSSYTYEKEINLNKNLREVK